MGQADNQICKIYIHRKETTLSTEEYIKLYKDELKERVTLFTTTLGEIVKDVGLVLKKEEQESRALSDVNTVVPSLYTKILTIHSAGLSLAQKSMFPYCRVSCLTSYP